MLTLICSLLVYLCPITFLFPVTSLYDYVFSENGLVAYKNRELIHKQVSVLPPPAFKTKSVTNFPLLLFFQTSIHFIVPQVRRKTLWVSTWTISYPHFVNVPNARTEHCWKLICVSLKMETKNGDSRWRGWGGGGGVGVGEEGKGERGATFHGYCSLY